MGDGSTDEFVELVARRAGVIDVLLDEPLWKRDILDRLDTSRSTANRAIKELEDAGLVKRTSDGYVATVAGQIALERHRAYRRTAADIDDATDVLASLPPDARLDARIVSGSDTAVAADPAPYRPAERLHETIAESDHYRAALPALDDPRHVRLLYEHVVSEGNDATIVVSRDLLRTLQQEFPRRTAAIAETDRCRILVGDTPQYSLVRTEEGGEATVSVVAFSDDGTVTGLLENETTDAIAWADEHLAEYEAGADDVTDRLRQDDGDREDASDRTAVLDEQGFVRLSREFFADQATADPVTAWRAGLDLAEVQTGYAVDRKMEVDGAERSLTETLLDRLRSGDPLALVGPPGCGKSTSGKRIACAWYRDDRGDVYYREGGSGAQFSDTDALAEAVTHDEGHSLVVVEDALRPDARAILDVLPELAARDDVAILLDSRESEWQDPPGERLSPEHAAVRADHIETVAMPPLSDEDYEAFVSHVERTVDGAASVPTEALRDELESTAPRETAVPGDALLLLHRAAQYADPLADDPTTLEADIESLYTDLATLEDRAIDVGVHVALLVAAGIAVDETTLFALDHERDTITEALDVLEGRLLFGDRAGRYRTVHEAYATAFLTHAAGAESEEAAAERFARSANAVLALAEEATPEALPGDGQVAGEAKDREAEEVTPAMADGATTTARLAADRRTWADTVTEQLYTLGVRYPKLAPLYGTDDRIELPDAASEQYSLQRHRWRGKMNHLAGRYDIAREEFDALRAQTPDPTSVADAGEAGRFHVEALLGLVDVAEMQGDHDRARTLAERALDGADALDDQVLVVRAQLALGRIKRDTGEMDDAWADFERALTRARERDDREGELHALLELGLTSTYRGNYETGIEYKEDALALARELGDRENENRAAGEMGMDYLRSGDPETAATWINRSLDLCREMGDRQGESAELSSLGLVELRQGYYEAAREHFEAAAEIERETGNERDARLSNFTLAKANYFCGDLDAAAEYAERGLEAAAEMDFPRGTLDGEMTLARVACERGEYEDALDHIDRSLEVSRDLGSEDSIADGLRIRGRIERQAGDLDAAADSLGESHAIATDIGKTQSVGWADLERAQLARDRGDLDGAVDHFESAISALEESGSIRLALDARLALADTYRDRGDLDAARDHYETGREEAFDAEMDGCYETFQDRLSALPEQADVDD